MTNIDYTVHTLEHSCEVSEKLVTQEVKELEENLLIEAIFGADSTLDIQDLESMTQEELKGQGMTEQGAIKVLCLLELGRRLAFNQSNDTEHILGSEKLAKRMMKRLGNEKQEHLVAIYLNAQNQILKEQVIFKGTVNRSIAEPREVLYSALRYMATSIILVHNHPSGSVQPSRADDRATEHMREACELMGLVLLDHLIVSKSDYYSYREETDIFA